MRKQKIQMSETYFIGTVLAIVGGYLDAYTYIARGEVFANAQTGNIVLLGIKAVSGEWTRAVMYLPPIAAFMLGILLSEKVRRHFDGGRLHWKQYIILLELIVVAAVSMLPQGRINNVNFDTIANILVSFVCSLQVQSFRKIRGITCATTMCTGNLRSATECLDKYRVTKDKEQLHNAGKFFGIVLFFIIGAAASTFFTNIFAEKSSLVCTVGLLLVFIIMFFVSNEKIPDNSNQG